MNKYVLFHQTLQGFTGPAGVYTSNFQEAAQFDYDTALSRCKRHADNYNSIPVLLPVDFTMLEKVMAK